MNKIFHSFNKYLICVWVNCVFFSWAHNFIAILFKLKMSNLISDMRSLSFSWIVRNYYPLSNKLHFYPSGIHLVIDKRSTWHKKCTLLSCNLLTKELTSFKLFLNWTDRSINWLNGTKRAWGWGPGRDCVRGRSIIIINTFGY